MNAPRRLTAVLLSAVLVLGLAACAPGLPETVVPGTTVTAGWSGELTSTNAAADPTSGNVDVAAATRAGFGRVVAGEYVPDPTFGTVTIVSESPFTVRYDLAEPTWSDGIPLDAADLLLGWAATSGLLTRDAAGTGSTDAGADVAVPVVDEFARSIDVTYPQPISDWQQHIDVAVPAHVVAARAFGQDDPMEAKQALLKAIRNRDPAAIAPLIDVWHDAFVVPEEGEPESDLLLSSGPFRVDSVQRDAEGQSVTLVPNASYRGPVAPKVATIELLPAGADPVGEIGGRLDVAQVAPVAANAAPIDALERRDVPIATTHDGTVWALLLRPAGLFATPAARAAFLRAIPARTLIERGGGDWASSYTSSSSMLTAPGTRAYDIATEDSGFDAALTGADDAAGERTAAGVAAGTPVCVLFDRRSEFAAGAFAGLRDAAQEAGWSAIDCGSDDVDAAVGQNGWDAVITRVPIPQSAGDIAAQWGTGGSSPLVGVADAERDALMTQLAQTTDVYAARDVRAQIEASIVRAAVALPIAVNPVITVTDTAVTGVTPRDGAAAPLTWDVAQWAVVP
nr:ABC transporter substrate-binding protein [Microbacterium lemovicicum]